MSDDDECFCGVAECGGHEPEFSELKDVQHYDLSEYNEGQLMELLSETILDKWYYRMKLGEAVMCLYMEEDDFGYSDLMSCGSADEDYRTSKTILEKIRGYEYTLRCHLDLLEVQRLSNIEL